MAASRIIMQSADGASVGLTIPDGLTSGERTIALGANISGVTAYHLLNGEVSVSNGIITSGFSTTLYTGNGTTQAVNTGIDMDTQWGNDASEKFGGLVWIKNRDTAAYNNLLFDSIRGATNYVITNSINAQAASVAMLTSFVVDGFGLGNYTEVNGSSKTYVSWNFQTTHRRTGTTNHGKAFTEHYNPFTGFTMIKYEGSGLAGHEIPHSLGRKLGFVTTKNLTSSETYAWVSRSPILDAGKCLFLHSTLAQASGADAYDLGEPNCVMTSATTINGSGATYILYGWANSYYDESNKLIGNYEIGVYQGTGAIGNKVKTKGKPAWIMFKRLDSTGNWHIVDNTRNVSDPRSSQLYPNTSGIEYTGTAYNMDFNTDGFTLNGTDVEMNASGGQYLYMVVYDNDNGSGKSKYPKATDSSQLQINALIPFANGVDGNGAKNTILSKNETITGLTLTQGKNYVYSKNDGSYGVKPHRPRYLSTDLVRTYAGESPDYYDVKSNKWFNCDAGAELVTNGKFDSGVTTGWSTDAGITLSVSNGALLNTSTISTSGYTYQSITTVIGKTYRFKAYINNVNMYQYGLLINDSSNTLFTETITATGAKTYDITFVAQSTTTNIKFFRNSSAGSQTLIIDNVTCFQTDITPTSEVTDSRNYLDAIVYADHNGQVEYVEQLPKTQYVDEIKANEFKGKNTIWGYAVIDCSTTQVTIKGIFGISSVIRTAPGVHRFYFENPVDNLWFGWAYGAINGAGYLANENTRTLNYIDINTFNTGGSNGNNSLLTINFYGGRN